MTRLRILGTSGLITLGLGAIACLTNPGQQGYQKYADVTLKTKLKDQVCQQVTEEVGPWLEGQCHILINTASPYLAQIVNQQTQRQNFFLLSIYQADIPLPAPLPSYHLETLGVLGNYYTYQAKKL